MGYRMTYSRLIGALFSAGFAVYGAGFGLTSSVIGAPDFLSTISVHQSTLVLGGIFELALAFWLLIKGFNPEAYAEGLQPGAYGGHAEVGHAEVQRQ